jgi:hypothetical protein
MKILRRDYKNRDLNQQIHSIDYLESFKNKIRISIEKISQYCRQYSVISKSLFDAEKIQSSLRSVWFLQNLLEVFNNEFFIKHDLNDDDEIKMNFDILMHQILQLCRFKITIKKTRKMRFKILKIIALVDEMQLFLSHERDENASDLMRKMKIKVEATVKQISLDMKKITDVMKKMTINVNNLVNYVFMTAEAKKVSLKITSAFSASVMSMIDFATIVDAQSYVTSFFEFLSFAFTDRSSLNKCLYCFSKNHLYKRNCKAFNDDLISNRVHLQDKRVHLESYSPDAQHVRIIKRKSQRQCVKKIERLSYSISSQTQVDVHIVRLSEETDEKIFIEDEVEVVLVNHVFITFVNVILATTRNEFKSNSKVNKHHESIKRILKRKIEKEEKLSTAKTVRQENWKKAQEENASTDKNIKDAKMTKVSESVKIVREIKKASVEKKTRFTFKVKSKSKEKIVENKVEEIMSIRKIRDFARLKMMNLWKKNENEKEFLEKIKKVEIIFNLFEIIVFISLAQKIFFKSLFDHEILKFKVNVLKTRTRSKSDLKKERWYFCESSKVKIILNDMIKTMIFLDSRTEINVMTQWLMNMIDIVMRSDSRLKLISHIEHDMNFDEICDDVEVNIDEFRMLHHIFMMFHANH